MPGVGFGLGKERLLMLMESCDHDFGGEELPEIFVAWIGDDNLAYSLGLLNELRKSGIRAVIDTKARNLKGQLKYANKLGAKYSVVIGEDEVRTGELTLKNMVEGTQIKIDRNNLISEIRK